MPETALRAFADHGDRAAPLNADACDAEETRRSRKPSRDMDATPFWASGCAKRTSRIRAVHAPSNLSPLSCSGASPDQPRRIGAPGGSASGSRATKRYVVASSAPLPGTATSPT